MLLQRDLDSSHHLLDKNHTRVRNGTSIFICTDRDYGIIKELFNNRDEFDMEVKKMNTLNEKIEPVAIRKLCKSLTWYINVPKEWASVLNLSRNSRARLELEESGFRVKIIVGD